MRIRRGASAAGNGLCFMSAGVPRVLRASHPVQLQTRSRTGPRRCLVRLQQQSSIPENGKDKKAAKKKEGGFYKDTVNLPSTKFDQRANATKTEPELQSFWEENKIYERIVQNSANDAYTLHDGPPYANGEIHMGHALNKILKDFINRYQLQKGRKAVLIPGWDCHGLPIELKVLQSMKSKERSSLTPITLRERAKDFALETVERQKQAFKRLGIWASWEEPYLTLAPDYEAAQVEVFGKMYLEGYIFRGMKPVHWSPSSRTALAEAELEYPEGHVSRSVYAAFQAKNVGSFPNEDIRACADGLRVAVWTTTPWTLPANRAVAVNPALTYAIVCDESADTPQHLIIAKALVETVAAKIGRKLTIVKEVKGSDLEGLEYVHPVENNRVCTIVIGGDYITTETGTGLVHTAPGHGQEDYIVGMKLGLEVHAPVDAAGKFTAQAANGEFDGMDVLKEGNEAVVEAIRKSQVLLLEEKYSHKYPYDWRTKKPTIFRATEQWFASVEGFRERALEAVQTVSWFPEAGEKRIRTMIEGRSDWCISRQRNWGVPIPAFYDPDSGDAVINTEIIDYVAQLFRKEGSDAWWKREVDELLPEGYRGRGLVKGTDTMDVWFDSGSSWNAVARQREGQKYPTDLCLEGSDQHRGWFQSSLLTSVATQGVAPYKTVLTHGFVLDEKGFKMSKSLGNVMDPLSIINGGKNKKTNPPYGADVLRLWVASVDYSGDVLVGDGIIKGVAESYRKIRNTLRYLVSNVNDFKPAVMSVPFADLPSLDRYMLRRLAAIAQEIENSFENYNFARVYQTLLRFVIVDLSNFYLDIAKDRLYISGPDDHRRRSCQTVLAALLDAIAKISASILPHTAEDLWRNIPWRESDSVFEAGWLKLSEQWFEADADEDSMWEMMRLVRTDVNKCLDLARSNKRIGAGLQAIVHLYTEDEKIRTALRRLDPAQGNAVDELKYLLLVSGVVLETEAARVDSCEFSLRGEESGVSVGVDVATGSKCDRCWVYSHEVGTHADHPLLCDRCEEVVSKLGIEAQPVLELVAPEKAL